MVLAPLLPLEKIEDPEFLDIDHQGSISFFSARARSVAWGLFPHHLLDEYFLSKRQNFHDEELFRNRKKVPII